MRYRVALPTIRGCSVASTTVNAITRESSLSTHRPALRLSQRCPRIATDRVEPGSHERHTKSQLTLTRRCFTRPDPSVRGLGSARLLLFSCSLGCAIAKATKEAPGGPGTGS
jgi:hypothetical protein